MLSKKILSLSLATGLAVSTSLNTFACSNKFKRLTDSPSDSTFKVAESSTDFKVADSSTDTEIVPTITEILMIPACVKVLLNEISRNAVSPEVINFCNQLKHAKDMSTLIVIFKHLYVSDPEFKQIFDNAWVKTSDGEKQHASSPGKIRKCGWVSSFK